MQNTSLKGQNGRTLSKDEYKNLAEMERSDYVELEIEIASAGIPAA
jgi:hypothetical protein